MILPLPTIINIYFIRNIYFIINFTLSCVVRAMQNRRKKALVFAPAKAA